MSKKMWNRIFKTTKSSNKSAGISKKSCIPTSPTTIIATENRLSYYEEFHNCCQQQQQPPKEKLTCHKQPARDANSSPAKTPSKFSKVVNTFTLKRNSKENQSNQLNTNAAALDTTTSTNRLSTNHRNGNNNYSPMESVGGPNMDKITTPTATNLTQADNTTEASEEPVSLELIPCPTCSRTFVQKTLQKHIPICEKMAVRKRKVFDSSRQRREGTELASYSLPKNFGLPPSKSERGQSPRPAQAPPPPILSPKKPPEEKIRTPPPSVKPITPVHVKKLKSPSPTTTNLLSSHSTVSTSAPKERIRAAAMPKRIQPPPAEPCPYCERCFGVKAYDRHVEWCKEKALIASMKHNNTNTQAAAKERLEARTKYRAPCLKTKRSLNRDKYSCYNDESAEMHASMMDDHHMHHKAPSSIMSSSMTSSIISDGGLSDTYDPFMSAKRQLEELCSPSSPTDKLFSSSNQSGLTKTPTKTPTTPTILNKMTTSLTSTPSQINPRRALTTVKSNFRRTSSLRAPRRSPLPMPSRPIFFPTSQKQRPTIQRGLSDEGPISSNFLKPEEYDEMPVRSVCVNDFAISNTPKVIRRDSNAAANRKNLRLQIPGAGQRSKENSLTPPVGNTNNNLLKTDSLAVFLKYENEVSSVENPVINTKELKDKSNTLSKQNSAKSVISTDEQQGSTSRTIDIPSNSDHSNFAGGNLNCIKLDPILRPVKQTASPKLPTKRTPPGGKSPIETKPVNLNLIFDGRQRDHLTTNDADYIDPKLINVCDNLPMDLGKDLPLSSNSSSSPSSMGNDHNARVTEKTDVAENKSHGQSSSSSNSSPSPETFKKASSAAPPPKTTPPTNSCSNSNRNSGGDGRSLLKRKMRLGRNQFLYDASPENETHDNDADDEGNHHRSPHESDRRKSHQHTPLFMPNTSNTGTASITNLPPPFSPSTFDEFDFEEFLSSFDNDDDKFPSLFKDCREFLMNRSTLNKRSNIDKLSSYRSTNEVLSHTGRKYEQDVEQNLNSVDNKKCGEIFISIETDQNENDPHPKNDPLVAANPTAQVEEVNANDNKFRKIEDEDDDGGEAMVDENENRNRDHRHEVRRVCGVGGRGEEDDDHLRMRRINLLNDFPNVRLNNAKNLIQQMHKDFRDLHSAAVAAATNAEDEMNDEISSIECYPVRINKGGNTCNTGGRGGDGGGDNGVQSKHSADSAYGSLSRQSPTGDINYNRGDQLTNRTRTATPPESPRQSPPYKYTDLDTNDQQKYRSRNFSVGSSGSGSDNSLSPIGNIKPISHNREEYQLPKLNEFHQPYHRNPNQENRTIHTPSPQMMAANASNSNNLDPPSAAPIISPTMRMSKFCHECGSRFLLEQAKFCMNCGVRRIVLK